MSVDSRPLPKESPEIGVFPEQTRPLPQDWRAALACLISSRAAIFKFESKAAAQSGGKKVALLLIAAFALIFTWMLLLVGCIGGIAAVTSLSWYHIAFAAAGLHVLVAIIALLIAQSEATEVFPITRAEFEKDREWLNQLKKPSK